MDYLNKIFSITDRAKILGVRELPGGGKLLGHIPHVAPEAWLHEVFAPLNDKNLNQIEMEIKKPIPFVFREFLKKVNGLMLFSCSLSIYGYRVGFARSGEAVWQPFSLVTPNTIERPKDAKESLFCIGGYGWDGSRLYIDGATLKVFRAERRSTAPINEWNTFEDMLVAETARIALLFDDKGHRLVASEPTTPN